MTDEIEPLYHQFTTNIEEHEQMFAKINEIIDNLAPTVEEAEAATATANAAIADANRAIGNANTAISNANAAIATADAASSEATTAAETVAGYAARLSAIEAAYIRKVSSATQTIDSDLQIVNGHDLAVAGDLDVANNVNAAGAEIAGAAFEKNGAKTRFSNEDGLQIVGTTEVDVADTTTGVRSLAAVNGRRLQNDLDAYASMIRTTGSQEKVGVFDIVQPVSNASWFVSEGWTADTPWVKVMTSLTGTDMSSVFIAVPARCGTASQRKKIGIGYIALRDGVGYAYWLVNGGIPENTWAKVNNGDGTASIWVKLDSASDGFLISNLVTQCRNKVSGKWFNEDKGVALSDADMTALSPAYFVDITG